MKIETIYEFIVLSHYLNFTTAANNLNLSQSVLSKHIAELERELGVCLLKREKAIELTPAGSTFLDDAIQLHHQYKMAVEHCREVAKHPLEEIIIQDPFVFDALSEIIFKGAMRLRHEKPFIKIRYYAEKGKKSVELLEQGKIDVAFTVDCNSSNWIERISEKKNLIFYPVVQEPLFVWLPTAHPMASKDRVTLEELASVTINMTAVRIYDPMRFAIIDLFSKALGKHPILQTNSSDMINEFFMNTRDKSAVFLVSESMLQSQMLRMQQDMTSRIIDDDRARITSYLVLKVDYQSDAIDALLEAIDDSVANDIIRSDRAKYLSGINE